MEDTEVDQDLQSQMPQLNRQCITPIMFSHLLELCFLYLYFCMLIMNWNKCSYSVTLACRCEE